MGSQRELQAGVRPVLARSAQLAHERVDTVHGWYWTWQFPTGVFWPVCACGYITDDGFLSIDEALAARCERHENELLFAGRL